MLQIDAVPDLREPVLVLALSGWLDAGLAGAGALAVLTEQLEAGRRFAHVDLADHMDLQQHRPMVHLRDGATREIVWPSIELSAGRLGRDVVLLSGPEPSLHWRRLTSEIAELAQRLGIVRAVTLGGIPAVASHRRPVSVLATATDEALADEVGAWRVDYSGPVGCQTVLQLALAGAGVPGVGLWAQVPHYVSATPSPPAMRAVLERLSQVGGITVETAALAERQQAYVDGVDEGLVERPDVAQILGEIEEADEGPIPSGDDIASEIERFLRGQG